MSGFAAPCFRIVLGLDFVSMSVRCEVFCFVFLPQSHWLFHRGSAPEGY